MTDMPIRLGNWEFRPPLIPSVAFLLVLTLLLGLGRWQLHRAADKQGLIDAQQARQHAPPLQVDRETVDPQLDRFRPARVRGHFVDDQQWLLDNRLYRGQAGYHVFSLLQLENGQQLLVNRGWVSVGPSRDLLPDLPLPQGELQLTGHLDSPESVGLVLGEPPVQSIAEKVVLQSLDVQALAKARKLSLQPLTLVLDAGQPGALQYDWSPVQTITPEKHLGYAVQWFAMATALTIIYFGVNTRRADRPERDEEL